MSEKRFEIKFKGIDIIAKTLEELKRNPLGPEIKYDFNFSVDVRVAPKEKLALVLTDIEIKFVDTSERAAFFKTICAFEFPEFDEIFPKAGDNQHDIPIELEIMLKSTGLSTTRGIVYSELRGTYLQGTILPLIDIANLVRKQHQKQQEQIKKADTKK